MNRAVASLLIAAATAAGQWIDPNPQPPPSEQYEARMSFYPGSG